MTTRSSSAVLSDDLQTTNKPSDGRGRGKRRKELVEHADRLFSAFGFHNVSFDDIAQAAGIKREGIYYYFKNTTELLFEIVEPPTHRLIERLSAIAASQLSPEAKLYLGLETHIKVFNRTALDAISLSAGAGKALGSEEISQKFRPLYKRYEDLWMSVLFDSGGADKMRFKHPRVAVFATLGMCNWMVRWFREDGDASLDEIVEIFFDYASTGLFGEVGAAGSLSSERRNQILEEIRAFELVHGSL